MASCVRVRVAETWGSTPREAGASMVVFGDGIRGTIGGGRLEFMAIEAARGMLAEGGASHEMDVPLGPEIGQCCGGRVRLVLDRFDGMPGEEEPSGPTVLILGGGHVGRAVARALLPLPVRSVLIDTRAEELALAADGVVTRLSAMPEADIRAAPSGSAYLILTHDHALDFMLAAEALARGDAAYVGLIGSATKRARFERWLRARADAPSAERLVCPIGGAGLGDKRPEVIAAFTAVEILRAVTPRFEP